MQTCHSSIGANIERRAVGQAVAEQGSWSAVVPRFNASRRIAMEPSSFFPPQYRTVVDEHGRLAQPALI